MAVGIGWALNRFASGTVALAFVFMKDNLGVGNTFFVYLVGALLGLWFSWLVVPETKGEPEPVPVVPMVKVRTTSMLLKQCRGQLSKNLVLDTGASETRDVEIK